MNYKDLPLEDKKKLLEDLYHGENLSWIEVGRRLGISVDIAKRNAKKLGIQSRSTKEAAKLSIESGRSIPPMKGKELPEETKQRISNSLSDYWENVSDEEKENKSKLEKEKWSNLPIEKRLEIIKKGQTAIVKTTREGSKLERFFVKELVSLGYRVDSHKSHIIRNTKMHIDIFIRSLKTIIEIDGPAHFKPLRGEEQLQKIQSRDAQKTGLILSEGLCLIRVKQVCNMNKRNMVKLFKKVEEILNKIKDKFPPKDHRLFHV